MAKFLIPALAAGAAIIGVAAFSHQKHQHEMKKLKSLPPPRPPTPEEVGHRMKFEIENYISQSVLDPYDFHKKRRFVQQAIHDHSRRIPGLWHRHQSLREIRTHSIAVAEKICHQLHIHLKPRCRPFDVHPRGVGRIGGISHIPHKKSYSVNIYELDYNHVPTPTQQGRGLY